VEEGLINSKVL